MKKVKQLILVGTLALAMMLGVIVHDVDGSPTMPGTNQVQAGIILHDGTSLDYPPGPSKTTIQVIAPEI